MDDHFKEKIRTLTSLKESEISEIGENKKQEEKKASFSLTVAVHQY